MIEMFFNVIFKGLDMKRVFFRDLELLVYDSVYEPAEDSFLLAESVRVKQGSYALDIGCGCGIQAINLAMQGANVVAVDISRDAAKNTLENAKNCGLSQRILAIQGDLFNAIAKKKFDCIVFNPPYLPLEGPRDKALDGGPHGYELLHRFLAKVPKYLKKHGACYFVQSSLSDEALTKRKLSKLGLSFEIVEKRHFFFEELMVFKAFL